MNLRLRLTAFFILLFVFLTALVILRGVLSARETVLVEVQSTANLATRLLDMVVAEDGFNQQTERLQGILDQLARLDDEIRHLEIEVVPEDSDIDVSGREIQPGIDAPGWFVALVSPGVSGFVRTYDMPGGDRVVIRTNPGDEIEEAWEEAKINIAIDLLILTLFNVILVLLMGYWLKPMETFITTLDEIEKGDFSRRIPNMRLPELEQVAERMNRLTSVLGASKSENDRLTRRSLMIQEQERRFLAQELHDAMGQSISAIKAIAVSIEERSSNNSDTVIAESASKIEDISDKVYSSVRGMMGRLRPSVLDELGLEAGLQYMVDEWNEHHEDTFCRLRIEGDFSSLQEAQQIHTYRIVQEALTNIAKHAKADTVDIALSGREVVSLIISDNGLGYDQEKVENGMGLLGIRDRVQTLRGMLNVTARIRQGVSIQIEYPRHDSIRKRRASDVPPR